MAKIISRGFLFLFFLGATPAYPNPLAPPQSLDVAISSDERLLHRDSLTFLERKWELNFRYPDGTAGTVSWTIVKNGQCPFAASHRASLGTWIESDQLRSFSWSSYGEKSDNKFRFWTPTTWVRKTPDKNSYVEFRGNRIENGKMQGEYFISERNLDGAGWQHHQYVGELTPVGTGPVVEVMKGTMRSEAEPFVQAGITYRRKTDYEGKSSVAVRELSTGLYSLCRVYINTPNQLSLSYE